MDPSPDPQPADGHVPDAADAAEESPTPVEHSSAMPQPPGLQPVHVARPLRPGQLTTNWSTVFWLAWAGVAGGFAAVWYSSRLTGLATWWLGPETEPRLILVSLAPFVAPLLLAVSALLHRRWLPYAGILGALVTAAIGLGDVGRPARYHLVEFLLAACGLLVSVASFAGMYRAAPTTEPLAHPSAGHLGGDDSPDGRDGLDAVEPAVPN